MDLLDGYPFLASTTRPAMYQKPYCLYYAPSQCFPVLNLMIHIDLGLRVILFTISSPRRHTRLPSQRCMWLVVVDIYNRTHTIVTLASAVTRYIHTNHILQSAGHSIDQPNVACDCLVRQCFGVVSCHNTICFARRADKCCTLRDVRRDVGCHRLATSEHNVAFSCSRRACHNIFHLYTSMQSKAQFAVSLLEMPIISQINHHTRFHITCYVFAYSRSSFRQTRCTVGPLCCLMTSDFIASSSRRIVAHMMAYPSQRSHTSIFYHIVNPDHDSTAADVAQRKHIRVHRDDRRSRQHNVRNIHHTHDQLGEASHRCHRILSRPSPIDMNSTHQTTSGVILFDINAPLPSPSLPPLDHHLVKPLACQRSRCAYTTAMDSWG